MRTPDFSTLARHDLVGTVSWFDRKRSQPGGTSPESPPKLHAIGYWCSERGDSDVEPGLPHPRTLVQDEQPTDIGQIVAYLKAGHVYSTWLGYSYCRFEDGPPDEEMGTQDCTDGVFSWPQGLPIYVERYQVRLPAAFIERVRSLNYRMPVVDSVQFADSELDFAYWLRWAPAPRRPPSDRRTITLTSGRAIRMAALSQRAVYEYQLEGVPTRDGNQHIIDDLRTPKHGEAVALIEPEQRPIQLKREYPFGEPAKLPAVACTAMFRSLEPARDLHADYSKLTVVWFQEEFALPIAPEVLASIENLNWAEIADDDEH